MKTAAWIFSVLLVLTVTGYGWAQSPVPISPGSDAGKALVISGCPTFSWAEVIEATGYKLVVFAHDAIGLPLIYEDIAATQTPVLEHNIPVRAHSWTPSADQGLCAGTYLWYVAAVQWGEILEWSEGKAFTVDALAALDAASRTCVGAPNEVMEADDGEAPPKKSDIGSEVVAATLSLEQVISSEMAKKGPYKSSNNDRTSDGTTALGPIAMGVEGASNTFYGDGAGSSIDGDQDATFIGAGAGSANTIGTWNTFVGRNAGSSNITHNENTFIGAWAGRVNQAGLNTFTGAFAGYNNTNGTGNIFYGRRAGYNNTTGTDNTFIGLGAGHNNTIASDNIFVGARAGYSNTEGESNTFVGEDAGYSNISGVQNTFIGLSAGGSNTSGNYNTFIGYNSGYSNTTASNNTFLGWNSGATSTTGEHNTFIGLRAGYYNFSGLANTFVGSMSGYNTSSFNNSFLGMNTGYSNTTGFSNTLIGQAAGYANTTGTTNTFLGASAGISNSTGHANTFLGMSAGFNNEAGSYSVFIGYRAGYNETGSNKLYIDNSDTDTPLIYGEFDNDLVKIHGELQMIAAAGPSDKRLKKDIKPLQSSLDKIQALQGVSYQWKTEQYPEWGFKETKQIGLVAQNVEDVIPELVSTDSKGYRAVSYDKLTAVLVEAVKELKAENDQLKSQIEELRKLMVK